MKPYSLEQAAERSVKPVEIKNKTQIEVDPIILDFLGELIVKTPEDLITLKNRILAFLEFRPYNAQTKEHANSIQWKRTASDILRDKYVYEGKACSDLVIVFLALCKAAGLDGRLVKLKSMDGKKTHSLAEIQLNGLWYRFDVASKDSVPVKGELTADAIWNKTYKVYKKGRDVWDLGLESVEDEKNF